jgi:hypothetical protein
MKRRNQVTVGQLSLTLTIVGALILAGCSGGGSIKPQSATYFLRVLAEKNLDSQADYLHVEFLRNDSGFAGAFVVVAGDTIRTKSSGTADTTYTFARWQHGHSVSIKAVDTAKAYVYTTVVVIPDSFGISNIFPNTHIWQPNKSNPRVEWTASAGAANYIAAIQARGSGSPSRGQSVIAGSARAYTFTPNAFYNPQTNQLVPDVYYIHVVAYAPTFVLRPGANYKVPTSPAFPLTVDTRQIAGAVAAVVVSARDSIVVSPSL